MQKFRQLNVWQKMHQLVLEVYRATASYPDSEKYGLTSQMRRCAVSVAANISEGSKRRTIADRSHFHTIADGSLQELKYYFILSLDLGLLNAVSHDQMLQAADEVGRMLNGLTKSIKKMGKFQLITEG